MSEHKLVTLNGQILHGTDRLGRWKVTQLEGWFDSAPVRSQDVARANADGDFDLPTYYGARPVTIGGRVICSSQAAAQQVRARITGLVQGLVRVQIMDEGVTTWADVKLTDAPTTKRTGSLVRFQYQLRSPNAPRFGDGSVFPISQGQSATVFHRGNYAATPIVAVTGTFPNGYTLTGPGGKTYVVTAALAPGTTHTIDMAHGLLRTNQYYFTGGVGDADVWTIPPGNTVTMGLNAPSGSGTATITVLDTYI